MESGMRIPFNRPYVVGKELEYIQAAVQNNAHLSGNGFFTKKCQQWLEEQTGASKALLTHSGTAALEMTAILSGLEPGDEVIMPSYTFVSTANAFVMRGAVPVFVDVREDTLNIDETKIEAAITAKTRVIVVVHYGGVACEMDAIMQIAKDYDLLVIEDAAHGVKAAYKEKPLGGIGHFGIFSFHETKNLSCGEGGALLINDPRYAERAEIIWEKGTNRSQFFRGQVDKYTWMDLGSSFLPSELQAAFLWAQMEQADQIIQGRLDTWHQYQESLKDLEARGYLRRPVTPEGCAHNAHLYYLLVSDPEIRAQLLKYLNVRNVNAVFHYVPLHLAPAGVEYGRTGGELTVTESISERIIRLPLWNGLTPAAVQRVVQEVRNYFVEWLTPATSENLLRRED